MVMFLGTLFRYLQLTGGEIFGMLRQKHRHGFDDFIQEKICPLPGDIVYENLGLGNAQLEELSKDIDIIVNGAATTNFFERYVVFSTDKNSLRTYRLFLFTLCTFTDMTWLLIRMSSDRSTYVNLQKNVLN